MTKELNIYYSENKANLNKCNWKGQGQGIHESGKSAFEKLKHEKFSEEKH